MKSPFKFLDSYQKEDVQLFFGREQEVDSLYRMAFHANVILVYGMSGTGKTSLINCGLANRFASTDWFDIFIRRKDDINQSLIEQLRRHDQEGDIEQGTSLAEMIRSLYLDHLRPIYLIFDQLEELITLGHPEEQQQFYENIKELASTNLPCKIILIIREEYLAHLSDFEAIMPSLFDNRIRVEPMNFSKIRQVIFGNLNQFNVSLESEGIVDRIMEQLSSGGGRVQLGYLQVYLDNLYKVAANQNEDRIIFDHDLINRVGQFEDVLSDFLDDNIAEIEGQVQSKFPDQSTDSVRQVLDLLVTEEGTKKPIYYQIGNEETILPKLSSSLVSFIINLLGERRIIRFLDSQIELAHDALANHVNQRRSEEDRIRLQIIKLIRDGYKSYQLTGLLLSKQILNFILSSATPFKIDELLSEEEQAFIKQSELALKELEEVEKEKYMIELKEERKRINRTINIITVIAVFAIVLGTSIFYNQSRQNALKAQDTFEALQIEKTRLDSARFIQYLSEGNLYFVTEDWEKSLEQYQKAQEIDSSDSQLLEKIKQVQQKMEGGN